MLVITNEQLEKLENIKLASFVNLQYSNLLDKQEESVKGKTKEMVKEEILSIIKLGQKHSIRIEKDLEYLVNVFVKYSLTPEFFNQSKECKRIFHIQIGDHKTRYIIYITF